MDGVQGNQASPSPNSPQVPPQMQPMISSIQEALSLAVSSSIPALVKSAIKEATSQPDHKRKQANRKRSRSSSSDSSRSSLPEMSPPSPHKRTRKTKHLDKKSKRKLSKAARRGTKRKGLSSSSSSSPSELSSSQDQSSDSEVEEPEQKSSRLFPADLLKPMVAKASNILNLQQTDLLDSDSDQDRAEAFPKSGTRKTVIPFPKAFRSVFTQEWHSRARGSGLKIADKFYSLPEKQMALLQTPTVDPPVASLASSCVPVDGDIWPKNPSDRRMETSLKRSFEFSSCAFRAESATSVMSRAAFIWAQEASKQKKLPKSTKSLLKRIALASAFASDASLDAMRFSARAMSSNVTTRRTLWLKSWTGEPSSHNKLINLPFEGGKLFGKALDPILVEAKDKRKILPPGKRDSQKSKTSSFRSFRTFRSRFRDTSGTQAKSRWTNASVLPSSRPSGNAPNRGQLNKRFNKNSKSA